MTTTSPPFQVLHWSDAPMILRTMFQVFRSLWPLALMVVAIGAFRAWRLFTTSQRAAPQRGRRRRNRRG